MRSTIGEAAKWTVQEEPRLALVEHQPWEGPAPVVGEAKTGPSRPRPVLDTGEGGKLPFLEGAAAQPGPRQRRALADGPAPTTGPPRHQLKERVKQARMS
jgi:hypothetical protein